MIDVRDLTIGCYVYDGDRTKFPMYVQTIGEDYVYLNFEGNEGDLWESTPEELQGIPLTRGLLEKAGFRKMSDDIYIYYRCEEGDYYEVFIYFDREEETKIEVIKQNISFSHILKNHKIKFFHELQNIFFWLNKKNLEVEL
jgi:hypothetical protein